MEENKKRGWISYSCGHCGEVVYGMGIKAHGEVCAEYARKREIAALRGKLITFRNERIALKKATAYLKKVLRMRRNNEA